MIYICAVKYWLYSYSSWLFHFFAATSKVLRRSYGSDAVPLSLRTFSLLRSWILMTRTTDWGVGRGMGLQQIQSNPSNVHEFPSKFQEIPALKLGFPSWNGHFLSHGGPPSHPFSIGIFHHKPSSSWGFHIFRKPWILGWIRTARRHPTWPRFFFPVGEWVRHIVTYKYF